MNILRLYKHKLSLAIVYMTFAYCFSTYIYCLACLLVTSCIQMHVLLHINAFANEKSSLNSVQQSNLIQYQKGWSGLLTMASLIFCMVLSDCESIYTWKWMQNSLVLAEKGLFWFPKILNYVCYSVIWAQITLILCKTALIAYLVLNPMQYLW